MMIGNFAMSKSGHDKGNWYVIVKEDDDNYYLSDGRLKPLEKLKKKNKKHVQIAYNKREDINLDRNESIKYSLKLFRGDANV